MAPTVTISDPSRDGRYARRVSRNHVVGEEEISDGSLATFCVFDKEDLSTSMLRPRLAHLIADHQALLNPALIQRITTKTTQATSQATSIGTKAKSPQVPQPSLIVRNVAYVPG